MTVAVPTTTASTTAADSAATAGRRRHQSQARSAAPTRRAAIGRRVEPAPQVVGQGLGRRRTAAAGPSPGTSGRSSPGRAGLRG